MVWPWSSAAACAAVAEAAVETEAGWWTPNSSLALWVVLRENGSLQNGSGVCWYGAALHGSEAWRGPAHMPIIDLMSTWKFHGVFWY